MFETLISFYGSIIFKLALSVFLGGLVGYQREQTGRAAGLRTYAMVSLGSTLFTLLSIHGFAGSDPSRIAAQIITGIGFIGAGTILHKDGGKIEGLTTAAGLWTAAAMGMAVAVGWYIESILTFIFMLLVLLFNRRSKKNFFVKS